MKTAVIGAGISGLGTAWILSQTDEVHLFESEGRLGGHAHTVQVHDGASDIAVDTGFLVYNELTYPHLKSFFKTLAVETVASDMSLAIKAPHKNLEWAGTNLDTVFSQRLNVLRPGFLRMLYDITRFQREAEENREAAQRNEWSLGQLIHARGYSDEFKRDYLLPIGAAIWSTPERGMEAFPAETFLTFFINHRLLQISNRPVWRTVKGGSIEYVKKVAAQIPFIHLSTPVDAVERNNGKVLVQAKGETLEFDRVVFATHAPLTARMLKNPSDLEQQVLSSFRTSSNKTILHTDATLMPTRRKCWSSWNVLGSPDKSNHENVSLTYYINKLQPLKTQKDFFVTLNPRQPIQSVAQEFQYDHPQFDRLAINAQKMLSKIQGNGGVYFAGAWTRYGFHEDGLLSAVRVGEALGMRPPWEVS
ncbi:NAD(P)/FAD-dependent oxidoreductase [Bdellovibrio sp. KM01]|uniref:NAD(P)/FAD-dependent oxidoreductase n=1 Tax=Bdellovibrio sp. KM01 TaxID=2748865 RepID=UPI0015E9E87F|nr:FAD-dependent oxidoreductase [Bdellovibrio sp. KM01]QLY26415.1 FAD-dependent oxidoreductase [Bdellovibrio sp. KM01]